MRVTRNDLKRCFSRWVEVHGLDPEKLILDNYRPGRQRLYQIQQMKDTGGVETPLGSNWHTGAELYAIMSSMNYYKAFQERGY